MRKGKFYLQVEFRVLLALNVDERHDYCVRLEHRREGLLCASAGVDHDFMPSRVNTIKRRVDELRNEAREVGRALADKAHGLHFAVVLVSPDATRQKYVRTICTPQEGASSDSIGWDLATDDELKLMKKVFEK